MTTKELTEEILIKVNKFRKKGEENPEYKADYEKILFDTIEVMIDRAKLEQAKETADNIRDMVKGV